MHRSRSPGSSEAPLDPLAWGVVRPRDGGRALPAVRVGDDAVVLATLETAGLLPPDPDLAHALHEPDLNALIELGPAAWRALRERLRDIVAEDALPDVARLPLAGCEALRPVRITDFADFYASLAHATNLGRIFRPGSPAVRENWRHMPVGYHGRASTIVVSGTPVRRPQGQVVLGELAPTRALDVECELGYVCGPTASGPIAIDRAEEHVFGVVLVNDWSARDVQRVEYEPLGPFLGKSFATSMSAWITPLDALDAARVAPFTQVPEAAPYLRARSPWLLDVALEIELDGEVISRPPARELYWTPAQLVAHLTVNGATLTAGDLVATGTISGSEPGTEGSLAELWRGERWLRDGDEVVLRGQAGAIALGEVRGRVVAS
jgi:fumarylacetoacetase